MRVRRLLVPSGLLVALVGAGAAPAWAHAVFQQKTVPHDSHQELVLEVPAEKQGAQNSHIAVVLPDDFDVHSCTADEGWSCSVDNGRDPEHPDAPQVTFTRVHCPAEGGFKCAAEPAAAPGPLAPGTAVSLARVLHEPGEAGGSHDEGGGAPGQSFHFVVHTPAKAGDSMVNVDWSPATRRAGSNPTRSTTGY
jgi:Domain of unkown function (DUF1775)